MSGRRYTVDVSDIELMRAAKRTRSWTGMLRELGFPEQSGSARQNLQDRARRLSLYDDICDLWDREPVVHLRPVRAPRRPAIAAVPVEVEQRPLPDDPDDTDWMADAACRGTDPDLFFPERAEGIDAALAVCAGCPVRLCCLEYALRNNERAGIWGGLSGKQRRKLRAARPKPDPVEVAPVVVARSEPVEPRRVVHHHRDLSVIWSAS